MDMNPKMRIFSLTLAFACLQALPAASQQITKERALEKASRFMTSAQMSGTAAKRAGHATAQLTLATGSDDYFVFNDLQNGGWVIVGGDERQQDVLGYSADGHFDARHLPCNLQWLLDGFAQQTQYLRAHPEASVPGARRAQVSEVAPLLDCTWGQGAPYYNMCPTINGQHCLTGCVATAAAQIMYCHKWPERGRGVVSYDSDGIPISADLSQSVYQWDLMLPSYDANSSQASQDAVALLLRDVGYAFQTYYGLYDSAAGSRGQTFLDYFNYDQSALTMERSRCCQESWDEIITGELLQHRPVFMTGVGLSGPGHAMVIDGLDAEGYYHFNFGWDGNDNAYFSTSGVAFNRGQAIIYGLKKNEGGRPRYTFASTVDFVSKGSEYLHLDLWVECYSIDRCDAPVRMALAVENTTTHKIIYTDERDNSRDFHLTVALADGDYIVYPVARVYEDEAWQKVLFADNRQSFVDLNVTGGRKTFTDNHIFNGLQDGACEVDGVYYFLDHTTHEASVTFKNDHHDGYAGNVTIPGHITYDGTDFTVTAIDNDAFESSVVGVLTIPNTVKVIKTTAFSSAKIDKLVFEPGSQLQDFVGISFNGTVFNDMELNLPEGLRALSTHTFQSAMMSWVSLPSTLTTIDGTPFNYSWNLRYLVANNPTPITLDKDFFVGIDWSLCTLYVPKGCVDSYAMAESWKDFGQIKELEDTATIDRVKYILHADQTATVFCAYGVKDLTYMLPSEITWQGKRYVVTEIGPFAFNSNPTTTLTVPTSVTRFGEACLYDRQFNLHLTRLRLYHQEPPDVADMQFEGREGFKSFLPDEWFYSMVELRVPVGCKAKYQAHSVWGRFPNIVEDTALGIAPVVARTDLQSRQAIYTLSGVRLPDTTDIRTLPKGIYIQGGKTIIK
jgi:hypothetical protein